MSGRAVAVVGPSGAGKDTLIAGAVARSPSLHWARRVITRPAREGDEPFEPATREAFDARLGRGEFLLHWEAHGLAYGIPATEFAPLAEGRDVIFNGSRAALTQTAGVVPGLIVVLVTASPAIRAARLAARGREAGSDIASRLGREVPDLPANLPCVQIDNGDTPAEGVARLLAALAQAVPVAERST